MALTVDKLLDMRSTAQLENRVNSVVQPKKGNQSIFISVLPGEKEHYKKELHLKQLNL